MVEMCWEWSVGIKGVLSSVVGVGGATLEGPGCAFVDNFMRDLAKLLSSTNANGNIPIRSSNFPSAQFSSTLLITDMTSPLLKVKQPSSSSLVIRKSYNALHCGL